MCIQSSSAQQELRHCDLAAAGTMVQVPQLVRMKKMLLRLAAALELPPNPLDQARMIANPTLSSHLALVYDRILTLVPNLNCFRVNVVAGSPCNHCCAAHTR